MKDVIVDNPVISIIVIAILLIGLLMYLVNKRDKKVHAHNTKVAEDKRDAEKIIECPKCHINMAKQIDEYIVIDKCPKCEGIFLDHEELEKFTSLASNDASNDMMLGVAVGMAMTHNHNH